MCDLQKLLTSSFLSVYKKKVLGTFILHLLNCINFMKIDEKSIVELQISMNLVQ